ncbi:KRI1-like family protein [Hirsutella rhossiliensis]|uniref:KRI1-like family domain-containing protein n=1 Tax=Hirsutella rhossiliensis TaxID=111463 RepID=A0A9P8SDT5_9HYPO|nr:KRI1-like family domain-containing protein [Hirsutella rhossiliensis]KAH0959088.1 KRI1-like family domain-containing protein [Hirsutella rhossiliensis]
MAPSALKSRPASESGAAGSKHPKLTLLEDSDSDSDGGAQIEEAGGFKVNEEYARRFEHNKKREEQHRLEEKYKKDPRRAAKDGADSDGDESSSSNETEDEEGFLATEDLDAQISATLHAIRNKDPRVYDKNVTFVKLPDEEALAAGKEKKEKPVYLRDYQREKILRGDVGASDDEEDSPRTYAEEQDALRKSIVSEIHATHGEEDESSDDDGFMKKKESAKANSNGVHPSRATTLKMSELDVANANKNPETFLSNFLASRAWIPEEGGKWKAFESDDDDDNDMADEWEQAYNMRFEDPAKSNEVLKSYARDFAAARSVRREEKTGRKRQRELEREKKEEGKRQRREEKARLRKLKLEETGEKLRMVKQAAGAVGKQLREEEWMQFLDDAWDNDKWEEEMKRRFGDDYYAMEDRAAKSDDEAESGASRKKKGPKKPKWDDDIDIKDIIPDFEDDEARPPIALSDDDNAGEHAEGDDDSGDDQDRPPKKRKTTDHKRARLETQQAARRERSRLEALVDSKLELTNHELLSKASASASSAAPAATAFRYRETSPQSFGLTARDILLAPSDQALNDFAGLKKLASFRDEQKKRRDRKRLGKKARLREWRRGTFGREFEAAGPTYGFERVAADADDAGAEMSQQRDGGGDGGASRSKGTAKESKRGDAGQGQGNVVGDVGGARKKKRKRSKGKGGVAAEDA